MALNLASRHGLVIASVAGISSLMVSISQIMRLKRMMSPEELSHYSKTTLWSEIAILAVAFLAALLSILLFVGIVKKRRLLLVTWLAAAFPIAAYVGGEDLYKSVNWGHFDHYTVFMIGVGIVFIYPICQLFFEMRREKAVIQTYIEPK